MATLIFPHIEQGRLFLDLHEAIPERENASRISKKLKGSTDFITVKQGRRTIAVGG